MKIKVQNPPQNQSHQTLRVSGVAACDIQAATWRGEDLLFQIKKNEVLILKGVNAKRQSNSSFFLVFDDVSIPLATFAPNLVQPTTDKAPHVPPFETTPPVKVSKLPGKPGRTGPQKNATLDADDAWADQALAILAQAEAQQPSSSAYTPVTATTAETVSALPTLDVDEGEAATVTPSSKNNVMGGMWSWPELAPNVGAGAVALSHGGGSLAATFAPATSSVSGTVTLGPLIKGNNLLIKVYDVDGNLLGSETAKADGSFAVSLSKMPVNGVIRVDAVGVSDGKPDYIGEDGVPREFVGVVSAIATLTEAGSNTINITHVTDLLVRKLASMQGLAITSAQVKATSAAFAKALSLGDGTIPLEQIAPKATVAVGSNDTGVAPSVVPDLYGQVLKAVFEQVKVASTGASASTSGSAQDKVAAAVTAANTVLTALASNVDIAISGAIGATPKVVVKLGANNTTGLAATMLSAKVANFAQTPTPDNAPTATDYRAAGVAVTSPEAVFEMNRVAVAAVKTAESEGATNITLVDAVITATTQAVSSINTAPTAVALPTALANHNIAENTPASARIKVADLAVTDADGVGTNTYTLGGADAAYFEVDGQALYLKAGTALNFEAKSSYAVTVAAQDSSVAGSASTPAVTYTLNVSNVNEAPATHGVVAPVTATVGAAMADVDLSGKFTDVDAWDALSYSLKAGSTLPAGLVLSATTGHISGTPTRATSGATRITVVATDSGNLSAEQTFAVTVNPAPPAADTIPPTFVGGTSKTVSFAENATRAAYIAAAVDNVAVTSYVLAGGADDGLFNFDTRTGAISFKTSPNYEVPGSAGNSNAYVIKVKASDAAGNSSTQTITINVTNLNDAPTGGVSITGTATQGQTLTASHTLADADGIPVTGAGAISY
ncbi:putative Ig domain-containing protein, partial [Limnohabitans sp.]|uniref:putative Ig domain-containing protein n=1 Tax=Limnohabitans sp. TaxID=1907725 RepID=UPI00286EF24F